MLFLKFVGKDELALGYFQEFSASAAQIAQDTAGILLQELLDRAVQAKGEKASSRISVRNGLLVQLFDYSVLHSFRMQSHLHISSITCSDW